MVLESNVDKNLRLNIDLARIEDTRAVSSILAKSFYDFPDFVGWIYPFLQFTINEDLRYRLRSRAPLSACLVATLTKTDLIANPEIVGTVEISLRSTSFWSNEPQYPYISNLAVKQNYRRMGIGSQLLTKCEAIALDWGYQETRLHVLERNDSAKQLYCQNGYQISQIEANWGNLWLDYSPRLLLKKIL